MKIIILDREDFWRDVVSTSLLKVFGQDADICGFESMRALLETKALDEATHFVGESRVILSHPDNDAEWHRNLCGKFPWLEVSNPGNMVGFLIENEILPRGIIAIIYTNEWRRSDWEEKLHVPIVRKTVYDDTQAIRQAIAEVKLAELRKKY